MSIQTLLQSLRQLRLFGMANALEGQFTQPTTYADLSFEERIGLLLDCETTDRNNRRRERLLKAAKLRIPAHLVDIDYQHPRGLHQSQMAALQTGDWIRNRQNLLMTGPTGCGKTWLACAMGHMACDLGFSVRYFRMTRLLESLTLGHGDGSYSKTLSQLAKCEVLILDDWGLDKLTLTQRKDCLEIMEDRHGLKSTLVTSQLPITEWHAAIGDPTLADAILDRLVHNAHQLKLKGESMRKVKNRIDRPQS